MERCKLGERIGRGEGPIGVDRSLDDRDRMADVTGAMAVGTMGNRTSRSRGSTAHKHGRISYNSDVGDWRCCVIGVPRDPSCAMARVALARSAFCRCVDPDAWTSATNLGGVLRVVGFVAAWNVAIRRVG